MSPALAQAGAGAASSDVKKESATARLLGSGMKLSRVGAQGTLLIHNHRLCWYRRIGRLPPRTIQLPYETTSHGILTRYRRLTLLLSG